jgi:serine/threonine-protein kinase
MPEPRPKHTDLDAPPLTLADSSEGSTMPVPAGRADAAGSSTPAGSDTGEASQSSGPLAAGSSGQGSTGFETMLGELVVQRGLATAEEVEICNALRRDAATTDQPQTVADLLVARHFVTRRQLDRIRGEVEVKKSSEQIPGYKIKRKLGAGAMATVFLARQLSLDRLVAIKVLPTKLSSNTSFIDRFYKEGRAAAQLNDPNIVGAYDVGQAGDHHYFVMEYVEGSTVFELINKQGRIEEAEAVRIVIRVARALKHAHERGFIHRDIKPKNIMIAKDGTVKLADLGLARALSDKEAAEAEAGRAYGTPYYISPEQIRGEVKIGPAADIYGLGATMYHMVTGKVPFEGKNPSSVMPKPLQADLTPPDHLNPTLSGGCASVIEKMMAKSRKDRYRSDEDLLTDLELIGRGERPHFAQSSLDLSTVAATLPGQPVAAPAAAQPVQLAGGGFLQSPAFMILLIAVIVSLLVNAVLVVVMVTK